MKRGLKTFEKSFIKKKVSSKRELIIGILIGVLMLSLVSFVSAEHETGHLCTDNIDNDGDGKIDKNDPQCAVAEPEKEGEGIETGELEAFKPGNVDAALQSGDLSGLSFEQLLGLTKSLEAETAHAAAQELQNRFSLPASELLKVVKQGTVPSIGQTRSISGPTQGQHFNNKQGDWGFVARFEGAEGLMPGQIYCQGERCKAEWLDYYGFPGCELHFISFDLVFKDKSKEVSIENCGWFNQQDLIRQTQSKEISEGGKAVTIYDKPYWRNNDPRQGSEIFCPAYRMTSLRKCEARLTADKEYPLSEKLEGQVIIEFAAATPFGKIETEGPGGKCDGFCDVYNFKALKKGAIPKEEESQEGQKNLAAALADASKGVLGKGFFGAPSAGSQEAKTGTGQQATAADAGFAAAEAVSKPIVGAYKLAKGITTDNSYYGYPNLDSQNAEGAEYYLDPVTLSNGQQLLQLNDFDGNLIDGFGVHQGETDAKVPINILGGLAKTGVFNANVKGAESLGNAIVSPTTVDEEGNQQFTVQLDTIKDAPFGEQPFSLEITKNGEPVQELPMIAEVQPKRKFPFIRIAILISSLAGLGVYLYKFLNFVKSLSQRFKKKD